MHCVQCLEDVQEIDQAEMAPEPKELLKAFLQLNSDQNNL